ncbi:MAG: nitroreductase family protein [Lentisphaeria bacterium]|nr:nitroreductase family protein [Lentisphaeria bacterium]
MEFYDVIRQRRSIRAYRKDPVKQESLDRICQAVLQAPTACNRQPFKLLIVRDEVVRQKICSACKFTFLAEAPVLAVMLCNESEAWTRYEGNSAADIDASIAMEHFVLSAAAEGLGTCWICAFSRPEMDRVLGLEGSAYGSFALSPLGYASAPPREFVRKEMDKIIEFIG